jgi:hypothetical protein
MRQRILITFINWERVRNSEANSGDSSVIIHNNKSHWNSSNSNCSFSKITTVEGKYNTRVQHKCSILKIHYDLAKVYNPEILYRYRISEYFRKKDLNK